MRPSGCVLLLMIVCVACVGCRDSHPEPAATAMSMPLETPPAASAPAEDSSTATPRVPPPAVTSAEADIESFVSIFEPYRARATKPRVADASLVQVNSADGANAELPDVRLLGFTRLKEPKALLTILGRLELVAAGDSAGGLEVTRIAPPRVTLRTPAGERTMSLFEQATDIPGDARHPPPPPGHPPSLGSN